MLPDYIWSNHIILFELSNPQGPASTKTSEISDWYLLGFRRNTGVKSVLYVYV